MANGLRPPVSPGELAPDFVLPTVDGSGIASLSDYRDRRSVFLALFVGLWCPFCRRAIAHMAATDRELKAIGVETLGIVATPLENAQLYFRFRPSNLRLAVDPELSTHRAYGVPKPPATPELLQAFATLRINPNDEFPQPLPIKEAADLLTRLDGHRESPTDHADMERQWPQLKGQFLIDPHGIIRWANIECASEGLAGLGKFPSTAEILAAAGGLFGSEPGSTQAR